MISDIPQLSDSLAIKKVKHYVARAAQAAALEASLASQGLCVLHGYGGSGKSTLALHHALSQKAAAEDSNKLVVRIVREADSSTLLTSLQHMASELKMDDEGLMLKITKENPLLEWWDEFCKRF